jgi:hypothetical protein
MTSPGGKQKPRDILSRAEVRKRYFPNIISLHPYRYQYISNTHLWGLYGPEWFGRQALTFRRNPLTIYSEDEGLASFPEMLVFTAKIRGVKSKKTELFILGAARTSHFTHTKTCSRLHSQTVWNLRWRVHLFWSIAVCLQFSVFCLPVHALQWAIFSSKRKLRFSANKLPQQSVKVSK